VCPGPFGVLFIPRRPTAIFYDSARAQTGQVGSEPDEYNYFYGPKGIYRAGGAQDGTPFFATERTYQEIVDHEALVILRYLLRGEMYPLMFHQANLFLYDGEHTLLTHLMDSVAREWAKWSVLPVISVEQSQLGRMLSDRKAYWTAGVEATLYPGSRIEVQSREPASVPLTGTKKEPCESYGPFSISQIAAGPESVTVVSLQ